MLDSHLIAETRPQAKKENILFAGDCRITLLTDRLFRMEWQGEHGYCDNATQAVWFRDLPPVPYTLSEEHGRTKIKTDKVLLSVGKTPKDTYVILDGKKVKPDNHENLKGTYRTLDGCNGNQHHEKDGTWKPIALCDGVVSKSGLAVMDDSHSLILLDDGLLHPRDHEETDIYLFAYGHDYRAAVKALYEICGKTPMIPRYALGNWWSRYYAYSDHTYLQVLDRLAKRDVPLTVATIDMDWHWSRTLRERRLIPLAEKTGKEPDDSTGWTGYSWNTDLFPDYRSFLKEVKKRNLRITMNLHPADGVRYHEDMYAEMAEAMGIDPKSYEAVPFDMTSDRFINNYFKILHKPYEHDGVDFWWIDWQQGTKSNLAGLDPLWSLNHYHTLDNGLFHTPLILSRYSGIGSHRYPLGFSGDTYVTWDSLRYISYFTSTAANVGYSWWSHDIGGHMLGEKDDEMFMRYVQFGTFSPINRLHCTSGVVCTKEPSVFMGGCGLIAERFLRLRHRMIPFLYSASHKTSHEGKALIEPMYYMAPDEKDAYRCHGEYLFGESLIVAPVTKHSDKKGMTATKVWLPSGHCFTDIFTGDEYKGGRWIEAVRWNESLPVLAKDGAFFVLDGREHTNSIENPDVLEVQTYFGNGSYELYEDDGGERSAITRFASESSAAEMSRTQTLTVDFSGESAVVPARRTLHLQFRNLKSGTVTVTENGKPMDFALDDDGYITVSIVATFGAIYCIAVTESGNYEEKRRAERIRDFCIRLQNEYEFKRRLCGLLNDTELSEWASAIKELPLTANEKKRIMEICAGDAV